MCENYTEWRPVILTLRLVGKGLLLGRLRQEMFHGRDL